MIFVYFARCTSFKYTANQREAKGRASPLKCPKPLVAAICSLIHSDNDQLEPDFCLHLGEEMFFPFCEPGAQGIKSHHIWRYFATLLGVEAELSVREMGS